MRHVFFIVWALIAVQNVWAGHQRDVDNQDVLCHRPQPNALLPGDPDPDEAQGEALIDPRALPVRWTFWNDLTQSVYLRKIDLRGFDAEEGVEMSVTLYRPMQDFRAGGRLILDPEFVTNLQETYGMRHLRFVFFYWPPGLSERRRELAVPPLGTPGVFFASHLTRRKRR